MVFLIFFSSLLSVFYWLKMNKNNIESGKKKSGKKSKKNGKLNKNRSSKPKERKKTKKIILENFKIIKDKMEKLENKISIFSEIFYFRIVKENVGINEIDNLRRSIKMIIYNTELLNGKKNSKNMKRKLGKYKKKLKNLKTNFQAEIRKYQSVSFPIKIFNELINFSNLHFFVKNVKVENGEKEEQIDTFKSFLSKIFSILPVSKEQIALVKSLLSITLFFLSKILITFLSKILSILLFKEEQIALVKPLLLITISLLTKIVIILVKIFLSTLFSFLSKILSILSFKERIASVKSILPKTISFLSKFLSLISIPFKLFIILTIYVYCKLSSSYAIVEYLLNPHIRYGIVSKGGKLFLAPVDCLDDYKLKIK